MEHRKSSVSLIGEYDKAIFEYHNRAIGDSVVMSETDRAISEREKQLQDLGRVDLLEGGNLFPFISIARVSDNIREDSNWSAYMRGKVHGVTEDKIRKGYMLPIELRYQTDIWAIEKFSMDEIYRELAFLYFQNPKMVVDIESGIKYMFPILYIETEDNTDIASWESKQKLYRKSMVLEVASAQLFMFKDMDRVRFTGFEVKII